MLSASWSVSRTSSGRVCSRVCFSSSMRSSNWSRSSRLRRPFLVRMKHAEVRSLPISVPSETRVFNRGDGHGGLSASCSPTALKPSRPRRGRPAWTLSEGARAEGRNAGMTPKDPSQHSALALPRTSLVYPDLSGRKLMSAGRSRLQLERNWAQRFADAAGGFSRCLIGSSLPANVIRRWHRTADYLRCSTRAGAKPVPRRSA